MTSLALLAALTLAAAPAPDRAPPGGSTPPAEDAPRPAPGVAGVANAPAAGPDVELHVPRAEVAKVALEVENLQARIDLDTSVADLVHISAGVVATVQKLKLQLDGVQAETHLVVRLQRVTDVLERALGTIDRHPDIAGGPSRATQAAAPAAVRPVPVVSADAAADPTAPQQKPKEE